MTSLREECEALRHKCSELETELAAVKTERDDYAATVDEFIKDYKIWQEKPSTRRNAIAYFQRWGWASSHHNTNGSRQFSIN
jgi:uncharacterized coiled-coil DUF342 family protein